MKLKTSARRAQRVCLLRPLRCPRASLGRLADLAVLPVWRVGETGGPQGGLGKGKKTYTKQKRSGLVEGKMFSKKLWSPIINRFSF